MQRYIVQRLLQGIVLLVMVAAIVFSLGRLTGNPADLTPPSRSHRGGSESLDQDARARPTLSRAVRHLLCQRAAR